MKLLQEFKRFVLRGNVVDLAVGIVIGAAFTAVVQSIVDSLITPLIGALGGVPDFSGNSWLLNDNRIFYGRVVTAVLTFLITAAVVFFLVVKPINALVARARTQPPPDPTTKKCPFCTLDIPIEASRCPNCTSELERAA
jgi:large conductance mechanosensitive channel